MADSGDMELLAPAGNASVALAAFDAGADAVYCGLRKFNARERSENFTHDELARVIAFAHKNRRKVYVTFNTLLKESELDEAADELAFLAEVLPDAVIVQDLGAARLMREYFPELTLHASTQLGIHNSAGLEAAKRFGFRRVILERQVTLDELRMMIPDGKPPLEMELFIHGALCCCVSGSCLFSSWLGGWSGNRGKCKQPCRRKYFSPGGRGEFLFSPDDLCSLELLDEFRKLGVCSLKIEGRLRRADYVEKVVRAYRLALDARPEHRSEALAEAGKILRGAVTRRTSVGFYSEDSMRELIRLDPFGGSGIPCGSVERVAPGGFEAKLSARLHVGDTIRVQRDADASDGVNLTVLHLEKDRKNVLKAQAGERCFIRTEKQVASGDLLYRTGEAGPDRSERAAALPPPKIPLDLEIALRETSLSVGVTGSDLRYELDFPALAAARNHAVDENDLRTAFASTASDIFGAGRISVSVDGSWFVPAAVLKEWRRSFFTWAEQNVPRDLRKRKMLAAAARFRSDRAALCGTVPSSDFSDCTAAGPAEKPSGAVARELDQAGPDDEIILPPIVPEGQLENLRRKIGSLIARGARVFRLTSFFQFALFPAETRERLVLKTMFPFPVCNSQTVEVCREFGASGVQAWIELGHDDFAALRSHSVLPLEAYVSGRPCIFMTRAVLPQRPARIRDICGNGFELEEQRSGLTVLYPEETLNIPLPEGYSGFYDHRKSWGEEGKETEFNFTRGWA
ncbi:MAG: U32 family peptidase [Lentisphaeria bacterium]|nr:U32 family peptidase [Lentisphaeria bacterium]